MPDGNQEIETNEMNDVDAFLYVVTHDLKAFARALTLIPEWLRDDMAAHSLALPDDVSAHLDMMQDYAKRLDEMLLALTELSRVGRLADPASTFDLSDLLEDTWRALAPPAGFRLVKTGASVSIHGPRNDVTRLISALLDNALRHHDKSKGEVRVHASQENGRVLIEISDDGPGIAQEFRTSVFRPLQTLRPKSETGRAGVGLTLAQKVVTGLGGTIRIKDAHPPGGCAVVFDLPGALTVSPQPDTS